MSSIDWTLAEAAFVARIRAATGLADGSVVFGEQGGPRETRPLITVTLGDLLPMGAYDSSTHTYDAGADPGEEIVKTVLGLREFWVNMQAFSATVRGNGTARDLLAKASLGLHSSDSRSAFDAVPMKITRVANVLALPGELFKTAWESRASMAVMCQGVLELSEATGYIANVPVKFRTKAGDPFKTFTI